MRAKITYLEGDFPSYIVASREECRDCVDRFAYDALKGNRERFAPKTPVGETGNATTQPKAEEATGGGKEQAAGALGREKEPWEIPVGEYVNRAAQRVSGQSAPKTRKLAKTYHSLRVRQAIKEGRNVPPEVLKDYPKLTQKPRA